MSNFDDDEALFDDIYGDDQPSNSVPQTSTLESSEKLSGGNSEPLPPPPPPPPPAQEEQYSAPVTETESSSTLNNPNNNQFDYSQAFQQLQQFQQLQPQQQGDQNQGQGQDQAPNRQQLEQFQQLQQQFQQFQQNQLQPNGEDEGQFQDTVKADLSGKDVGKLFIGGLNWETDEDALKTYFNQFGEVLEINVMRDNNTGKSRGFAFLTFGSGDSVDAVLKQKHILDGKLIDPKRAIPKEEQEKVGKVFVGGIAADVTPEEFKDYFEKFGSIIDSQLMINKDTGKSRGYGFVTYDSPDAVDRVTRNNYVMFHGKQMEIKKAEPRMQHLKSQNRLPGQMANPMASSQPAVMNQQYMMGGYPADMTQYWQQMQQMQQYWMQMQQMQQQQMSPDSQEAQLNMQSMFQNQMPSGVMDQQNDQQNDEDDVPNPQENESPSPPPSQGGPALKLPSGPKKFRESGGSGGRGGRSRGGFGGRGGRGGGRGRGRGRRDGFHPYRR